jgi:3-methyladenine DNA glycosylase AlkD
MGKTAAASVPVILKEIRSALDARADEKTRLAAIAAQPKSPVKSLGVRSSYVRTIARDVFSKNRATLDYDTATALVDMSIVRKIREEIIVSLEILERFRRDYDQSLFGRLDKWSAMADDLEIAEVLGSKVAGPLLALDASKMPVARKWAKLKSVGRRRLAVLAAAGLVNDGRRDATSVLELCEMLLNEEHPLLVSGVASLLKDTTRVDAKAVQDFLFRRSIDGNPDILRAGSENLDAARRAALIAKLEAQAGITPLATAEH